MIIMRGEYEELSCPFCDKGKIACLHIPSVFSVRQTGRNSLGSGKSIKKSSELWLINSGCSICGKTKEEVEKELRNKNEI
jgi:hypothetical protein